MPELERRFRSLDDVETPDVWDEVLAREPRAPRNSSPIRRIATAVVALGVFVASGIIVWAVFRPSGQVVPADGATDFSPDVLRLTCAADGTPTVLTPTVQAQPDGLHMVVEDPGVADEIWVQQPTRPNFTWSSGSNDLGGEFVLLLPPGESFVQCRDFERLPEPPQGNSWMTTAPHFTLVAPEESWVPTDLACSDPAAFAKSYSSASSLATLSPPDAARAAVPGIRATDIVESAGYVESTEEARTVRVVRDGRVIASMRQSDGDPGAFHGYACPGTGIGG